MDKLKIGKIITSLQKDTLENNKKTLAKWQNTSENKDTVNGMRITITLQIYNILKKVIENKEKSDIGSSDE